MSIITLLTDFGLNDEYAGIMKGVIFSVNPSVVIVDITHNIDPHDIIQAAFTIKSSYKFFPEGSVHVVIVDPGVGGNRAIIAIITLDFLPRISTNLPPFFRVICVIRDGTKI